MNWPTKDIERRLADPAHRPRWKASKRPPMASAEFPKWIHSLLDGLNRRAMAEWRAENEAKFPAVLAAFARALKIAAPRLEQRLAGARDIDPNAGVNDLVRSEQRAATGQSGKKGRTASGPNHNSPAASAARDLWRIRNVILPRFWPRGLNGMGLTLEKLAAIAAARHPGTTATAALAWYRNNRMGEP